MSRPKPKIYMEKTDPKTYKAEQIIKAEGVFYVAFDGKPVNIRIVDSLQDAPSKYKKSTFVNQGHAHGLAQKLNIKFKTTDFKVFMSTSGIEVTETKE